MSAFWAKSVFPTRHIDVTPDDDVDLPGNAGWVIYVMTDGDVEVHDFFGTAITYTAVAGSFLPVLVKRVLEGTSASVVALQ